MASENREQLADTADGMWAMDVGHQTHILDLIVNNDIGLFNDAVLRSTNAYFSSSWAAFIVANRLFEQLAKLVSPELEPRKIGHCVKTRWWDEIDAEAPFDRNPEGLVDGLETGFKWWNAMAQSPWADMGAMLDHLETTKRAKIANGIRTVAKRSPLGYVPQIVIVHLVPDDVAGDAVLVRHLIHYVLGYLLAPKPLSQRVRRGQKLRGKGA